jgi:dTMP kinase
MNNAKFISLEGIDGAGKSSHVQWLAERIRNAGHELMLTREPGGTPLGERLRELLLNESMDPRSEVLLAFAARQAHLSQLIRPALARGAWVLSDRFTDSTYAYQGGGRGVDLAQIRALEEWVQQGLQPDLVLYFDVPIEIGMARRQTASATLDRFEQEQAEFFERVRTVYQARAQAEPQRIRVIDGTRNIEQVRAQIENILVSFV